MPPTTDPDTCSRRGNQSLTSKHALAESHDTRTDDVSELRGASWSAPVLYRFRRALASHPVPRRSSAFTRSTPLSTLNSQLPTLNSQLPHEPHRTPKLPLHRSLQRLSCGPDGKLCQLRDLAPA